MNKEFAGYVGDVETEKITLAEMEAGKMHEPSGEVDVFTGEELTNVDAARALNEGYPTWVSGNGVLSQEAKAHNSALAKDQEISRDEKAAKFIVAVRGQRPVDF